MSTNFQKPEYIYKVVPVAQWDALLASQKHDATTATYMGSPHDKADGFIHACCRHQIPHVLNSYYRGHPAASHYVIEIDLAALEARTAGTETKVVFEGPAPIGGGPPSADTAQQMFPHVYGGGIPLNDEIIHAKAIVIEKDGVVSCTHEEACKQVKSH